MKGHDVNLPTTALHIAAYENHYEMCQLIISNIENKGPTDGHGSTPLHYAAQMGHLRICYLFIENGMPLNTKNRSSNTPTDKAKSNGFYDVVKLIESAMENKEEALKTEVLLSETWNDGEYYTPLTITDAKRMKYI